MKDGRIFDGSEVQEQVLWFGDAQIVIPGLVMTFIILGDDLILNWSGASRDTRNIARFGADGKRIWLIQDAPLEHKGTGYAGIGLYKDKWVAVSTFYEYEIDIETGQILSQTFSPR